MTERTLPLADGMGQLVPVGYEHAADEDLIAMLARWRAANAEVFPTRFTVTLGGTARWLRERVLTVPDRFMFLVVDPAGEPIGHAGLAHADGRTAKLDNVVRGVPDRAAGIMSAAVGALLRWSRTGPARELVYLPVFVWNAHAIRFYTRLGFRRDGVLPLTAVAAGERTEYVPFVARCGRTPDDYHLKMVYEQSADLPVRSAATAAGGLR